MKKELRSRPLQMRLLDEQKVHEIPLELIDRPGKSDRDTIDPELLRELVESIKEVGLQQPVLLRPQNSRYEIVAGDRRFLAHKAINAKSIKSFVREMTDKEAFIVRATENLQRENLSPLEEAKIYKNLLSTCGMALHSIAKSMGRSVSQVGNRLALLELPEKFQEAIGQKKMPCSVAIELMKIQDEEMRDYYLEYAVANGITTRVAQEWVSAWMMTTEGIKSPGGGSSLGANPLENVPVYMPCNFCTGPVDIRKVITLHICPECMSVIKKVRAED